jgi:hypothetical protein
VHLVENAKAIIRTKSKLPLGSEGNRPFQGLSVAGFHLGLETQLALDFCLDQGMVLGVNGPQVLLHLVGVHESEGRLLGHDYNYGRAASLVKSHAGGGSPPLLEGPGCQREQPTSNKKPGRSTSF